MNFDSLSSLEVELLIKSLKNLKGKFAATEPLFGKINDDTELLDNKNGIEYKLHRYRNPIQLNRYSIHIRFVRNDFHLIRLDINNGTHRNPDGTLIQQNHMHIYDNRTERKDGIAYPLPNEISNIQTLSDALIDFFRYTNIK